MHHLWRTEEFSTHRYYYNNLFPVMILTLSSKLFLHNWDNTQGLHLNEGQVFLTLSSVLHSLLPMSVTFAVRLDEMSQQIKPCTSAVKVFQSLCRKLYRALQLDNPSITLALSTIS